mmetsp:Transcript_7773/g.16016  ORF Transcript_7773/g.16016 Transcript_7773/m.16016 type:complete len:221 (+) Transcript_7773:754-1416(+)
MQIPGGRCVPGHVHSVPVPLRLLQQGLSPDRLRSVPRHHRAGEEREQTDLDFRLEPGDRHRRKRNGGTRRPAEEHRQAVSENDRPDRQTRSGGHHGRRHPHPRAAPPIGLFQHGRDRTGRRLSLAEKGRLLCPQEHRAVRRAEPAGVEPEKAAAPRSRRGDPGVLPRDSRGERCQESERREGGSPRVGVANRSRQDARGRHLCTFVGRGQEGVPGFCTDV